MKGRIPTGDLPNWPRGLSEQLAAAYVGLSQSTFRTEWRAGRAPKPVQLTAGRQIWLLDLLDRWLDAKAGQTNDVPIARQMADLVSEWDAACGDAGGPALS